MLINYLKIISSYWNSEAIDYQRTHPEHLKNSLHPSWGLWHIPEKELKIFQSKSLRGKMVLDLGCGRGHDSVAYAKMGACVLAIDLSQKQIQNSIPHKNVKYIQAAGENVPIGDSTIDMVISDHGAFDHSPAPLLLKEMKRILNSDGKLIICTYSPISYACFDPKKGKLTQRLHNKYPNSKIKYDGKLVCAEYSYSSWVKMFIDYGFTIERLEELVIPAKKKNYFDELVSSFWASRWPCDIIWVVKKND